MVICSLTKGGGLKSLLMKVKDESKNTGLKFNIQKTKIMTYSPISSVQFSSVQLLNCVRLFMTPLITAHQASLSVTNSLELVQTPVHWVSDAIQPSHPLLAPSPLAFNLSQHQGLFSWITSSHQVAKVLELQLQHHSFQRNPRVDLLEVQGTLKSLLQHHSLKASIIQCSAFFMVQLSHLYMTTGKTVTLNRHL